MRGRRCIDLSCNLNTVVLRTTSKYLVLLIGSRQQLSKIALSGVTVGESLIAHATAVRDLGAGFGM